MARRTYATDRDDLWDAMTNPERLPRWFLPVSGELRVGGHYQLESNASGTVEACDPPASFAATWEFGGQVSWITVALAEDTAATDATAAAGAPADSAATAATPSTILEVAHEAEVDPEFWGQFGPGAAGVGWDLGMMGLGLHLESDAPVDPNEAEAWVVSNDGKAFVEAAATAWGQAAMADGDDPDDADAAAQRAVAF